MVQCSCSCSRGPILKAQKAQHHAGLPWKPQYLLEVADFSPFLSTLLLSRKHLLSASGVLYELYKGQEINVSNLLEVQIHRRLIFFVGGVGFFPSFTEFS